MFVHDYYIIWEAMNQMKKIVSGIILAALVLQLCSCASDSPQAADSTDAATEAAAETSGYIDELAADWGGETLNIIVQHYSSHPNVPPEEMNGEAVDDALFARDRTVEEKLNISIDYIVYEDRAELKSDVQTAINAADASYDFIITSMADGLNTLAPEGYLQNLNDIAHLSLDSEWWSRSCRENLTFGGKQYITSGPISLDYYYSPCVICFNQRLCDEYGLPDLYEAVLSGKWTLDMYNTITKDVARDLDNDGIMGDDDFYAFACDDLTGQAFYIGCGGTQTEIGADGLPALTMDSEKNINILDRIINAVYDDSSRYLTEQFKLDGVTDVTITKTYHFKNAKSMLLGYNMSGIISCLRDMEDDYGIIPMPKLDENLERYLTYGSPWGPCGVAVPVTNTGDKLEMTGNAMEMMAYISQTSVGEQMYNVTLQEKVSRDENSKQMLDIIYEDIIFDLNGIHNFGNSGNTLRSCAIGRDENFMSKYASLKTKAETELNKLIEEYNSID